MSKAWARHGEELLRYNALDTVATARVYAAMLREPEWNTPRVQRLYEVHAALAQIASEMYQWGFRVIASRRQQLADELMQLYEDRERKFLELVNIPGMRCTPNDMRSLVYERYKTEKISRYNLPAPVNPEFYSPTGNIRVDQPSLLLLMIQPNCPEDLKTIIEAYWHAEGAWKARSTYVTSELVERAIGADGRLRAEWNSCGTDTGRWACRNPNLMNLSEKKDEDGGAIQGDLPSMRSMYAAAPGCTLVHADYSQLELRVMHAVSGDDVLGNALSTGDVYSSDARDIFGFPADFNVKKLKPAARKQAKIVHLGFQYGAGDAALFKQALEQDRSLSFKAVALIRKAMMKRYTGTVQYWRREHEQVLGCGYSESRILNRRRTYPAPPPPTETANYPIQSTASDIANLAMIELNRQLKKYVPEAHILVQLHDAFDVEVPHRHEGEVRRIMQETMEAPLIIAGKQFTFPVEIKSAECWGDV